MYSTYVHYLVRFAHSKKLLSWVIMRMQVTENWKERLQAVPGDLSREMDILRVRKCVEIALRCVDNERKNRPTIQDIVKQLEELEADITKRISARSAQSQDLVVQVCNFLLQCSVFH